MSIAPLNSAPLLVTYSEAARLLGGLGFDGKPKPVSTRHVERLAKAGKLRAVGQGRARRVVYSSILAYIEQVLPSLGEAGVELAVLGDLVGNVRFEGRDPEPVGEVEAKLDCHWVTFSKAAFQHVPTDLGHLAGIRGIPVIELLLAELAQQ